MTISQHITILLTTVPFLRPFFAKRRAQGAINLFEKAKADINTSTELANQVIKTDQAKIDKLQKEISTMSKLVGSNTIIVNNINTNILGVEE